MAPLLLVGTIAVCEEYVPLVDTTCSSPFLLSRYCSFETRASPIFSLALTDVLRKHYVQSPVLFKTLIVGNASLHGCALVETHGART